MKVNVRKKMLQSLTSYYENFADIHILYHIYVIRNFACLKSNVSVALPAESNLETRKQV